MYAWQFFDVCLAVFCSFFRRVVRWAANVSHGKDDRQQTLTKAEFVAGGTIGPVKIK
jgi:hypothetical protein